MTPLFDFHFAADVFDDVETPPSVDGAGFRESVPADSRVAGKFRGGPCGCAPACPPHRRPTSSLLTNFVSSTRSEPVRAERSRHGCSKLRLWYSTYATSSFSS